MNGKNRYVPNDREQQLIEILMDPANVGKSVSEKCELAGVSRTFYYNRLEDEEFTSYYRSLVNKKLLAASGELLEIGLANARQGGSGGATYWKELARTAAVISKESVDLEHSGEVVTKVLFVGPDGDELPELSESELDQIAERAAGELDDGLERSEE